MLPLIVPFFRSAPATATWRSDRTRSSLAFVNERAYGTGEHSSGHPAYQLGADEVRALLGLVAKFVRRRSWLEHLGRLGDHQTVQQFGVLRTMAQLQPLTYRKPHPGSAGKRLMPQSGPL